jgi:hypothetical protein
MQYVREEVPCQLHNGAGCGEIPGQEKAALHNRSGRMLKMRRMSEELQI